MRRSSIGQWAEPRRQKEETMGDKSKIDWCTASLNPFGWGCYGPGGSPADPKICPGCYAFEMSKGPYPRCKKCAEFIPHWHPEDLDKARSWKKPREIFWQSMGDMWHLFSPAKKILQVLKVARETPQHTHIFLTKNPARYRVHLGALPKDVYYGATVRNQEEANKYAVELVRLAHMGFKVFVSLEPLYSEVDLSSLHVKLEDSEWEFDILAGKAVRLDAKEYDDIPILSGVILGGENGHKANHPLHPEWVRTVRDQCEAASVPFFFKGWGEWKHADDPQQCVEYLKIAKNPKIMGTRHDALLMYHIGKKAAGRDLDGQEYNELAWRE